MKQTQLLVLAGGFGSRLRSAVPEVPKPLAPVGNRPFLHYLIERWVEQGVCQLTFLLHYQAHLIEAYLASQKNRVGVKGCEIRTLLEPQPLGTGGAIAYAVHKDNMRESFLVTNADTWLGSGVEQVIAATDPAMAVVKVESADRFGSVCVSENKVMEFNEKQSGIGPAWINAGLYHLNAELFRNWNGKPFSIEQSLFPKLASSRQLHSVALETDFIDIGIPEDYLRFGRWIESGKRVAL